MVEAPVIGFIGGSGLYRMEGLGDPQWIEVDSPFGAPSDACLVGEIADHRVVFLPRHGRGHRIPPSEINYRANIDALKRLGVTQVVSMSAVGSFREELRPGSFVFVDQFIDRTMARESSFFGPGLVAHVSIAHPVCVRLGDEMEKAAGALDIEAVRGGVYLAMEGPQFSSLAESKVYRSWGCDVIGMTNMPEAKLAREAELCYASIAMVTDYDSWHPEHDHVTVEVILKVMHENADHAQALIKELVPRLGQHSGPCVEGCQRALENAIVTPPEARDPKMVKRLDAVAGRVLKDEG